MKDKLKELSEICRQTVGVSCQMAFLKTGKFKVIINRGMDTSKELRAEFSDPEDAITDALEWIKTRQNPIKPYAGMPIGAKYSIKRESAYV